MIWFEFGMTAPADQAVDTYWILALKQGLRGIP